MSLLSVGARALLANQVALQTAGHNIANVNTPGYSRQTVVLQTVQGQFTGGGYIGQGVDVQTILRNQSELLTRQAATAGSVQSADIVRAERLRQLQEVFSGGTAGLGAAINDMMNAFSDVVSSPTDITARTVVLTRMDETAARMRSAADRLNEIQYTVTEQLQSSATAINSLATQIAGVNEQIARAKGNGQTPNDLLDQRDQLIRDINQYVQTTQIPADDGTVGLFVAGSQPLVLGTTATQLSVGDATAFPGSGQLKLFFNRPGATPIELDENVLGGGTVSGLLRFNNTDLAEGRNLLGRMAMAIGMTMNDQQNLGLTLDGALGKDLFSVPTSMPGYTNGAGVGAVAFSNPTQFAASDYEIRFTTGTAGQVVRLSDGQATAFTDAANLATLNIDGLTFNLTTPGVPGERMLFKPFSTAAANMQALVYSPRDLAAANPINAAMGTSNGGTMQLSGLKATGLPNPPGLVLPPNANPAALPPILGGIQLQFTAGPPTTYDVLDRGTAPPTTIAAAQPYTPGAPISINGWEIKLQGSPNTGDTVVIGNASDPQYGDIFTRNSGNASALMGLRDVKMFDESTLSDGYAGAMAQVGTRTQSSLFAAELSTTIAANLERDRTAISGVNLDEEAAKLIQYQQAYQASAKMIQIAQSIFDSLIQGIGR
ncbi:MAG: flagellar hook-associated protein FlgK [Gammaproteobacteria bacterium]|jgi:flagellar hook-associated protein 1|nr:flagellar hook-associated protein FlgK [Gammaproteobacteria bacterium]MBU1506739.1 flagellar hook-associated protein FlgK [Gammaproteobacteria bacterium]MBU2120619.1 flagellar hook-associated protein FlgK [Gammaproteobacteria bacterium]MBU2168997.1 flagellar hook-associated protein FlgK [Gammaproteobacteria bacterium]MBU2201090.1 flagellar hook-associated protein FlgK [Gammaproteobacteria bacterium]